MKWLLRRYYMRKLGITAVKITNTCEFISHSLHTGSDCTEAIKTRDKLHEELMKIYKKIQ